MTHPHIQTVLAILKDETQGDAVHAASLLDPEYTMTWMYEGKETLFPSAIANLDVLRDVYAVIGRTYEIKHIISGDDVVIVELIESYPANNEGERFRTPLVLVLEMRQGKIFRGRHYCDPRISHKLLPPDIIEMAFKGTPTKLMIE